MGVLEGVAEYSKRIFLSTILTTIVMPNLGYCSSLLAENNMHSHGGGGVRTPNNPLWEPLLEGCQKVFGGVGELSLWDW